MTRTLTLATAALLLSASGASAIGFLTQMSCASDYYAYCSQFQVGSKELRVCMRRAGPKLSKSCLNALIADGEVSKAEVEKTKQEILAARAPAKPAAPVKQKSEDQKQKRIAVAKADDALQNSDARSRGQKKSSREGEAPRKAEKLTINEQTFAALKQRQPKFIEEASAEEMPPPQDADKRVQRPVTASTSAEKDEHREQARATDHKKKSAKKSKAATPSGHKNAKAMRAAEKEKRLTANRTKRLAGE